jgi:hypothetical protein
VQAHVQSQRDAVRIDALHGSTHSGGRSERIRRVGECRQSGSKTVSFAANTGSDNSRS